MARSPYLDLERRIAADDRGGVLHRWRYGRKLLEAKAGRKQLPHGMLADLLRAADRAGLRVSEREIQYRLQCAERYESEEKVRTAVRTFGTWTDLRQAGFPAVAEGPDDLYDVNPEQPDAWTQGELHIPGLKPVLSIRGRKVSIDRATVRDVGAYLDMCAQMHESFGKTVDLIRSTYQTMLDGAGGDQDANAVDAWNRGLAA